MSQKLSDRTTTLSKSGGFLHIILPDGGGGYLSYKIAVATLLAGAGSSATSLTDVTGSQSILIQQDSFISNISFKKVSGTPSVSIGTTVGGTDIVDSLYIEDPLTFILVNKYFPNIGDYVYFTITGGNVNIRVDLINNYIG